MATVKGEEVINGFFGDLPEDIRTKIMNIHKIIVDSCNAELKRDIYDDIRNLPKTKERLAEFLRMPKDNDICGSVRLYKKGKRYRCMIQVTGHPTNVRKTEEDELFHGFIRNVHVAIRTKVRRQFDVTLTCESEHGESFDGYDIWPKQKTAKMLWEQFTANKSNKITKVTESVEVDDHAQYMIVEMNELPDGYQDIITSTFEATGIEDSSVLGTTVLRRKGDVYEGYTVLGEIDHIKAEYEPLVESFNIQNPCKYLTIHPFVESGTRDMVIYFDESYSKLLWSYLENHVKGDDNDE